MSLLEVTNLTKYYGDALALSDVNFYVNKGEFVSVIGPSGSGKTTLIRCINRLIEASSGTIKYNKIDSILDLRGKALRQARTKIGMIFQHYNLVNRLTVIENVLHGRLGYKSLLAGVLGIYTEDEKRKALEIIELLGLEKYTYRRCDQLSGGQKQRVGIARALLQEPKMILCDEPISSLDPKSAKKIMDYLKKVQTELGITVLVNLHQVDVALKYSDRILGFNSGKLLFDGKASELNEEITNRIYGTESHELIFNK
jgi:phosphonate transport system ATP-binding protein